MSRQLNKIVNCDNKSERVVSLQLKYVSRRNFKSNIIVNHWLINVKKNFAKEKYTLIKKTQVSTVQGIWLVSVLKVGET